MVCLLEYSTANGALFNGVWREMERSGIGKGENGRVRENVRLSEIDSFYEIPSQMQFQFHVVSVQLQNSSMNNSTYLTIQRTQEILLMQCS